jgi:hypothetical protein
MVGIRIFSRQWVLRRLQMRVLQELLDKPMQPDIALDIACTVYAAGGFMRQFIARFNWCFIVSTHTHSTE